MNDVERANVGIMAPMFKVCRIVVKTAESDNKFGLDAAYADGDEIDAYIQKISDTQTQLAEQQTGKKLYNVIVAQPLSLERGTILRREEDDLTVILTSDTAGSEPPPVSTVKIAKATAEGWVKPDE